jgi:hypothetical protein
LYFFTALALAALLKYWHSSTVVIQFLNVDVCDDSRSFQAILFRLRQHRAVFSDETMSTENEVCCRFQWPRRTVGVGGDAPRRLIQHETAAVIVFADEFIAGGEIDEDVGPGHRLTATRRHRDPNVFANLDSNDGVAAMEKQIGPEKSVVFEKL